MIKKKRMWLSQLNWHWESSLLHIMNVLCEPGLNRLHALIELMEMGFELRPCMCTVFAYVKIPLRCWMWKSWVWSHTESHCVLEILTVFLSVDMPFPLSWELTNSIKHSEGNIPVLSSTGFPEWWKAWRRCPVPKNYWSVIFYWGYAQYFLTKVLSIIYIKYFNRFL